MTELLVSPSFWAALFSVTLIQLALGADNLIIVANGADAPNIPQWIVILMLLLMFAVDLYQNWWSKTRDERAAPVHLHHRIDGGAAN